MENVTPNECVCNNYKYHKEFFEFTKDTNVAGGTSNTDSIKTLNDYCDKVESDTTMVVVSLLATVCTFSIFPFNLGFLLMIPTYNSREKEIYNKYKTFENQLIMKSQLEYNTKISQFINNSSNKKIEDL